MLAARALAQRARRLGARVAPAASISSDSWRKPPQPPARALVKVAGAVRFAALKAAYAAPLLASQAAVTFASGGGAEGISDAATTGLSLVGATAVAGGAAVALAPEAAAADVASSPEPKEAKVDAAAAAPAFNAVGSADNADDLRCDGPTDIPLLPRDYRVLLLDIEGTTTSISFVKDTLFPYVLKNLDGFLRSDKMSAGDLAELDAALAADLAKLPEDHPSNAAAAASTKLIEPADAAVAAARVRALMAHDVKATGLKSFQGKMWKDGYATGELVAHVYPDLVPALEWCKSQSVRVCIYSSGSIRAQKLLFGHTPEGDLTGYLGGYFDTTSGSKREGASYATIAGELGVKPSEIVFVTDLEAELHAARGAGVRAVAAVRPGNAPLSAGTAREYPVIRSLLQLCGC